MPFHGRFVSNIIWYAARQGADAAELIALTGHTPASLQAEDTMVDNASYNQIFTRVLAMTGDHYFGLHVGESLNLSAAGLINQIVQTSSTVKEALEYCVEFANLGCQSLPMRLEIGPEVVEVHLQPDPLWLAEAKEIVHQTADGVMAFTLREFHTLTRNRHRPLAIHLMTPHPAKADEYERVLECPVYFDCPHYAVLLERKHVYEPVVTSDYRLLQVLVAHAHEKLAEEEGKQRFSDEVRQTVIGLMKPGFPNVSQVAMHFNLSIRSLQRKLSQENTSYSSLLDQLRQEFATRYLSNQNLSVSEIAYLLDYSDPSAFIRTFRRWHGQTPQGYRKAKA